ncbi:MAG: glycosyltransferase, partial [Dehalococcoidia bacterium]
FPCGPDGRSPGLAGYVAAQGPPDLLWVDGRHDEPHVAQAIEHCPSSYKVVYGKARPQDVEGLERYDLCLVDEAWQADEVRKRAPGVQAHVWDKLIDYQDTFRPVAAEKRHDIVYVAAIAKRKNHELLFRAMARLRERDLSCVCVGGYARSGVDDPKRVEHFAGLQRLVEELGIAVEFAGRLASQEVNRKLNESRIGVMCSRKDSAPRAVLEYMAADIPVLVSSEMLGGQRYVGAEAGLVRARDEFHTGIAELLDNLDRYRPRDHYLRHFAREQVVDRMTAILREAGCPIAV